MKVRKWLKGTAIAVGSLLTLAIVAVGVLGLMLNTPSTQNKVLQYAVGYLSDKLQTAVQADSVAFDMLKQRICLYGLDVEDQQKRPMLAIDTLVVQLDLWELLHRNVEVETAAVYGLEASLLKPSKDEPANYQFVIDAFRNDTMKASPSSGEKRKTVAFDIKKVILQRIHVRYNDNEGSLFNLTIRKVRDGYSAHLNDLQSQWTSTTKKGEKLNRVELKTLELAPGQPMQLTLDGLHYYCDNGLPRKNTVKPKRGSFDAGHLDITAHMEWDVHHVGRDSIFAILKHTTATDSASGIDLRDLRFALNYQPKQVHLSDVFLQQRSTTLSMDRVDVLLPDSTVGQTLQYHTSPITGYVVLQDISQLFTPALSNFTIPLNLQTVMSGTATGMTFSNVRVNTADQRLNILANGKIENLDNGHDLVVRFHVNKMVAKGKVKEEIVNQFTVKKLMMKQFDALGTIGYTGNFRVLYKRVEFNGTLTTKEGNLHFNFALDSNTHYLLGSAQTSNFKLAQVFDVPSLGPVSFNANYKIDISKQRTAQMRRQFGGKLPIGEVHGTVSECSYKKITLRNLKVDIESDGANAAGTVNQPGRHVDVFCNFVMTSTDSIRQVKVRPKLKIHGLSEEDKQAKAEQKQQRQEEKAKRREERAEKREQRSQERAEKREQRRQERAARKADSQSTNVQSDD